MKGQLIIGYDANMTLPQITGLLDFKSAKLIEEVGFL